ncbi:MAG: heterodisulfide reductase subunit F [Candidatus Hydrothermota bacterium]|nr:MAG: heterodisulfide reductase subunit F [Candidatus Hydrothermae bacterium]
MSRNGNPYKPIKARLERVIVESDDFSLKTFEFKLLEGNHFDYMPGQFCEVSVFGKGEAPFGIASSPTEGELLKFTVNKAGVVTTALHEAEEGMIFGIRGPLGNWYPIDKFKGHNVLVVGGGFAFTTLRSLIVYILHNRNEFGELEVIYGARRPGLLLYRDELFEWEKRDDMKLHLTVDREFPGWTRHVGFVPQVLERVAPSPKDTFAVVCGPPIMIKFTLPVLAKLGFEKDKVYTSLEKRMKCGLGKCGRCNIGEKYICKDGPVFSLAELEELPPDL